MRYQNKHYKNIILEFNKLTVYVSASEKASFPKGDNNYNGIKFSLASIEVLNSKITQNLSHTKLKGSFMQTKYLCVLIHI